MTQWIQWISCHWCIHTDVKIELCDPNTLSSTHFILKWQRVILAVCHWQICSLLRSETEVSVFLWRTHSGYWKQPSDDIVLPFFTRPSFSLPSSCDWLTSLLILSYHVTSFWKDVHGVSLLDHNIALLLLLFYVRGEFWSSGQPSAVSNLHRHSGKTAEESQKEKDYFRNPWHHSEGARYGSSALCSLAPPCCLNLPH